MIDQIQGFRLSLQQKRLWLRRQSEQPQRACCLIGIKGQLDIRRLHAAIQSEVRRHQILHTTYQCIPSMKVPLQYIADTSTSVWRCIDLLDCSPQEQETQVEQLFQQEMNFAYEEKQEISLRLIFVLLSASEHLLLVSLPTLSADSRTFKNLVQEIGHAYSNCGWAECDDNADDIIQYIQFSEWQYELLKDEEEVQRGKEYWYKQSRSLISALTLPGEKRGSKTGRSTIQAFTCELPTDIAAKTEHMLLQYDIPACVFFLACWQTVLWRLTGERDIVVNTVLDGRKHEELFQALGLYTQLLPIHGHFTVNANFNNILEQLHQTVSNAETWQEYFVDEYDRIDLPIGFELEERPMPYSVPGVTFSVRRQHICIEPCKLKLCCIRQGHMLLLQLFYDAARFDFDTIERLVGQLLSLVRSVAVNPECSINEVDILSTRERQQLLINLNQTRAAYPRHQCFHRLFEEQVTRTPDKVAVVYADQYLTYTELNTRANQLAHHLHSLGVSPDVPVGIYLERSLEMIVGLLGVLKAGGAYIPLDPSYPRARLLFLLEDTQTSVLVTNTRLSATFSAYAARQVCLDAAWEDISHESAANPLSDVLPEHLAYVIYTSGSTGQPKGIMIAHQGLVNYLSWCTKEYQVAEGQGTLVHSSLGFDLTITSLFSPLLVGQRVVLLPESQNMGVLAHALRERNDFSLVKVTPSHLEALNQLLSPQEMAGQTRVLVIGGETLLAEKLSSWRKHTPTTRLINEYGPTETVVGCCVYEMAADDEDAGAVAIGVPIANINIFILDGHLQPVPVGVPGELYISGDSLARGYHNRPDLTAERFIPHPFSQEAGRRLYRTGDAACYLPNGNITYVGRLDTQVKLRGYRIELGEIEQTLRQQNPVIQDCVVIVQEDTTGDRRLVAYLVMQQGQTAAIGDLRSSLQDCLPVYMIPTAFILLDALPLTPHGKVDRRALAVLNGTQSSNLPETFEAPRTLLENHLAHLWLEMLHVKRVGVNDSFFDLGGDSIKAAIFINKLQEKLGVILYVATLFDAPTVAGLADYLAQHHLDAVDQVFGTGAHHHAVTLPSSNEPINAAKLAQIRSLIAPLAERSNERKQPTKNPPAIFVLSPPRSGSTLLRVMLAGHPRLFAPPELELLSFNTLRERQQAFTGRNSFWLEGTVRALMEINGWDAQTAKALMASCEEQDLTTQQFYALMQQQLDGRILVDKTPAYALDLAVLQRAEEDFAQARYIHLLRHPAAMIHSFEEASLEQIFFRHPHPFATRELAELVWLLSHQNIQEFLRTIPANRQIQVRFEELVHKPTSVMQEVAAFLQIEFHPAMVQPYDGQRMTDGIYAPSKMLGDLKFHQHKTIDATVASRWQAASSPDYLGEITKQMAETLGYQRDMSRQESNMPSLDSKLSQIEHLPREEQQEFPLSFAQQRLWFLDQLQPGSTAYLVPHAHHLRGPLNFEALERSLQEMIRRHESLRTTFATRAGQPVQVIHSIGHHRLPLVDLCGLEQEHRAGEAQKLAKQEATCPCDLERGPLLRTSLLQLQKEGHIVLLTLHHIITDGWSDRVFIRELITFYRARTSGQPSPLAPLPIQYADYALWQRQWLQGKVLEDQLDYWTRRLGGVPPIELPVDYPRPSVPTPRGAAHRFVLSQDLSQALGVLSRQEGVTLFMTLLAAFQVLFYRSTGQSDIVIGTDSANRNRAETEGIIGFFVNLLALRTDLGGRPSFREVLKRVREIVLGAYTHQETPFELLVEKLAPDHYLDRTPLVQVLFVMQNIPGEIGPFADAERHQEPETLDQPPFPSPEEKETMVKFDLALFMQERAGKLSGTLNYRLDLFKADTIAMMMARFEALLQSIVKQPDTPIDLLEMVSNAEHAKRNVKQELLMLDDNWLDLSEIELTTSQL